MKPLLLVSPAQPVTAVSPRHLASRGMVDLISYLALGTDIQVDYLDLELDGESSLSLPTSGAVGIGANSFTYPDALEIATRAEKKGLAVILGGVHVTAAYRQVKMNRPNFTIVRGDGEIPLLMWLKGEPISSDYYPKPEPVIDWPTITKKFKWEKYFQRQQLSLPSPPYGKRTWIIESRSGCPWRLKNRHPDFKSRPNDPSGFCIFCSTTKNRVHIWSPQAIWQEIQEAVAHLEVDSVLDWSDSLTVPWLAQLLQARPEQLAGVTWQCYLNAEEVSSASILVLKELGVTRVFIGMESGDNQMLRNLGKRVTPEENFSAFRILTDAGIECEANLVMAAPGETRQTLENTVRFVERLADCYHNKTGRARLVWTSGSILMPLPGAPIYLRLMQTQEGQVWSDSDLSNHGDLFKLREIYLRAFCPDLSSADLEWAIENIAQHSILKNEFGRRESPPVSS